MAKSKKMTLMFDPDEYTAIQEAAAEMFGDTQSMSRFVRAAAIARAEGPEALRKLARKDVLSGVE